MKKVLPVVIVVIVIAVVAGLVLGKQKSAPTKTTTPPSSQKEQTSNLTVTTNSVSIKDFMYSPETITVKKGTTVTWTNQDSAPHTVTADNGNGPDSGTLENGKSYSFTFNSVGTFSYHCTFHSDMKGTVTVTD